MNDWVHENTPWKTFIHQGRWRRYPADAAVRQSLPAMSNTSRGWNES